MQTTLIAFINKLLQVNSSCTLDSKVSIVDSKVSIVGLKVSIMNSMQSTVDLMEYILVNLDCILVMMVNKKDWKINTKDLMVSMKDYHPSQIAYLLSTLCKASKKGSELVSTIKYIVVSQPSPTYCQQGSTQK